MFTSYELGTRKPDPAIFLKTLDALEVPPEVVLFFDDNAANVATANDLGMEAHRVDRPEGVRARLRELGLI